MVRRGSTVRVRQRASGFFLLSSSFRCPSGTAADAADVHAASTAWTSTLSASDSARHDLDRGMDVVCFPRLDIPREGGAVVPLADAVQQVDLDLARAMLHAKARPMGFPRQAVATDGTGFGLTARISRFLHRPLVATGCARPAP